MAKSDFLGTGWKYPISVRDGKIALSEGENCIKESIIIILRTAKGERAMRPDFGCEINELIFAVNTTATTTLVAFHVEEALQKWEPRIELLDVNVSFDEEASNKLNINIEYNVKTTNSKQNLVYPFYLESRGA